MCVCVCVCAHACAAVRACTGVLKRVKVYECLRVSVLHERDIVYMYICCCLFCSHLRKTPQMPVTLYVTIKTYSLWLVQPVQSLRQAHQLKV